MIIKKKTHKIKKKTNQRLICNETYNKINEVPKAAGGKKLGTITLCNKVGEKCDKL